MTKKSPSGEASIQSPTLLVLLLTVVSSLHLLCLHLLCLHLLHAVSDGFCFHTKSCNQLVTRLLASTKSAESRAIILHLSTVHTESHDSPTPNLSLNPRIQLTICMNTGQVSKFCAKALSLMSSKRASLIISEGSTPASNNS